MQEAERSDAGSIRRVPKNDEAAGAEVGESLKPLMPRYVQLITTPHHSGVASGRQEAALPQSPDCGHSAYDKTQTCRRQK